MPLREAQCRGPDVACSRQCDLLIPPIWPAHNPFVPHMPTTRRFELTGERLKAVRKLLKPALPKKDQQKNANAEIRVERGQVQFAIPGASSTVDATTSGAFVVQMPWREFQVVLDEPINDGSTVVFEFEPGAFLFQGVTSRSKAITIRNTLDSPAAFGEPKSASQKSATSDPTDAAVGHPLLAAYRFTRENGLRETLGNADLRRQQYRVEDLLNDATKLLAPLGITRSDLEGVLERKLGS